VGNITHTQVNFISIFQAEKSAFLVFKIVTEEGTYNNDKKYLSEKM
jgi:hypothetical protein